MDEIELPLNWQEWKILEPIGSGAYGSVYRAERRIGADVFYSAIKIIDIAPNKENLPVLIAEYKTEESVREYYKDLVREVVAEIKTMNYLKGLTNIVSLEDYCVEEKREELGWKIYIRMELLQSFSHYQIEHEISEIDVIELGIQMCTALEYCEQRKIVHRDIKPENIFVSDMGVYKLGDFGVAKQMKKTQSQYSSRGTLSYMAPEVFRGQSYDIRADLYSLGIVMYRLLNHNREPFVDLQKQMIYYHDKNEAFTRRMNGEKFEAPVEASAPVGKIILKTCSFFEKDRYSNPTEMKQALLEVRKTETSKYEYKHKGMKFLFPGMTIVLVSILLFGLFIREFYVKENTATSEQNTEIDEITELEEITGEVAKLESNEDKVIEPKEVTDKTIVFKDEKKEVDESKEVKEEAIETKEEAVELNDVEEEAELLFADISDCASISIRSTTDGGEIKRLFVGKNILIKRLAERLQLNESDDFIKSIAEDISAEDFEVTHFGEIIPKGTVVTLSFTKQKEIEQKYHVRLNFQKQSQVYN